MSFPSLVIQKIGCNQCECYLNRREPSERTKKEVKHRKQSNHIEPRVITKVRGICDDSKKHHQKWDEQNNGYKAASKKHLKKPRMNI
jgi:hypothetical protein